MAVAAVLQVPDFDALSSLTDGNGGNQLSPDCRLGSPNGRCAEDISQGGIPVPRCFNMSCMSNGGLEIENAPCDPGATPPPPTPTEHAVCAWVWRVLSFWVRGGCTGIVVLSL
jgi:hypothetical protein